MAHVKELELSLQQLTKWISEFTLPTGDERPSLTQLGSHLAHVLHDALRDEETGETNAALVRMFVTMPFQRLDDVQKAFVAKTFTDVSLEDDTKCLTLIGTVGDEPSWCEIEASEGHQAIPLASREMVAGIPMIARLVSQLGLDIDQVLNPGADLALEADGETFNVFHVERAAGSEHIPAQQDFVLERGIESVVGFGSLLPTGHLCVAIIFSKVRINRETAKLFRPLALGMRMAVLPLLDEKILAGQSSTFEEVESLRALQATQAELLDVFRVTVVEQSDKLDATLAKLQSSNDALVESLDELNKAKSKLNHYEARVIARYAVDKLRDWATYRLALVVGTLINAYGHFLVPYLRGQPDVWGAFVNKLETAPSLSVFSILLAYTFPVLVQVHSAVRASVRGHAAKLRAEFPDLKPDPVFRAAPDGRIIDAGAKTSLLLKKHALETADQVLGEAMWGQILELHRTGERLPRETSVHADSLGTSYYVAHAPSADGAVNIYLTAIEPRG